MIPDPEGRGVPSKKPYEKPELTIYGSVVQLTQNNTQKGKIDNGGGNMQT